MLDTLIYGLAGLGCALLVYLIARCVSRAWRDLKYLEELFRGGDDW